jgi:hypothetical protein
MCCRHYEHHHAEALIRRGRGVLLAALLLVSATALVAGQTAVSVGGEVHTVEIAPWSSALGVVSTAVVHTVERPDGGKAVFEITGTAGIELEADPVIEVDPTTDQPIAVWATNAGSGFDLVVSRFDNGEWSEPMELQADGTNNRRPQLGVGRNVVHVVWRKEGGRHFRLCLDRETLVPVLPVEELPSGPLDGASDGGPAGPDEIPGRDWSFFSYVALEPGPESGIIVVLGARDEPIPITYIELFELPPEIGTVADTEAGFVSDTLVSTFVSGGRYHYSVLDGGIWSEFRVIRLSEDRAVSDARVLLAEMLERGE